MSSTSPCHLHDDDDGDDGDDDDDDDGDDGDDDQVANDSYGS